MNESINWKNALPVFLKGAAMGIAEVIPGVSGGTIAFISGIYERLLRAIKAFGPEAIQGFRQGGVRGFWSSIDGNFLLALLSGMAGGLIFGVFAVIWILDNYPVLIWAFFFGLILSSVWFVGKQIKKWNWTTILALALGTAIAFYITVANPGHGNEALWFVFVCGMLAICALMLPGISGSFILLLLGMYTYIVPTVKQALLTFDSASLTILAVFAAGAIIGLAGFSRILTWTFKHYHDFTMALMTGFMLGSLNKIWPWRNVLEYRTNSKGEQIPFLEKSVWPAQYDGETFLFWGIVMIFVGFAAVFFLEKFAGNNETRHE